ncbi:MAG: hypothetical protein SVR08_13015 [Spirochaetota bacterium]|nr:hypothetical protein [Spirochaetota bacterium]
MFKKSIFLFIGGILLLFVAACSDSDDSSSNAVLSADYEEAVMKIAPSLSSPSSRAITATGVTCAGSTVLSEIESDADLYKQWVGWDNDAGGALSPSALDGWMPYKEDDSTCAYIDTDEDDIPDMKDYAVLNKVFFGDGSSTIYGAAQFLDDLIEEINSSIDPSDATPGTITMPAWFGDVYTDETTSTSSVSMDNIIDMSSSVPSWDVLMLAYSVNDSADSQSVAIYMSDSDQISLFYARRNNTTSSLYMKSSFVDLDSSGDWASSHMTELRTVGNDFIIRKANKILGDGEPCCPIGEIYSHALIGGGSIASDSFFVLRWYEGSYVYSDYTKAVQPTVAEMREVGEGEPLSSAIYFIVEFNDSAEFNAKFEPLYGKGSGGGATEALPVDLIDDTDASDFFTTKPECADYTNADQFFTQSELPGWDGDDVDDFATWTLSTP